MNNENLTPDERLAENALICEKLLGLTKHCDAASCPDWRTADGKRFWANPTFDNWAEAGLILDALKQRDYSYELMHQPDGAEFLIHGRAKGMSPLANDILAIRSAALAYAKGVV